jgi:hypothetical protein
VTDAFTPTVAGKLGKLLRLLTSPVDGEALAAVRAIQNTLKNAKLDIHILADRIEQSKVFSKEEAAEIYKRGVEDGRRQVEQQQPVSFTSIDEPTWNEIAITCRDRGIFRSEREKEFVDDMVRRTVHGGELSEKQKDWLRKIYARRQ